MPSLALRSLVGPTLLWSLLPSSVTGLPSNQPVSSRADAAFTRLGCYVDVPQRALTGAFKASHAMTVQMCADFCSAHQYFGLEYGRECYCGNTRDPASVVAPDAECSFACSGARGTSERCGAGMRLDLFVNNAYKSYSPQDSAPAGTPYLGCFVDAGVRVLPERVISTGDMTPAKCAANCAGYPYFGTEWGRECYCGNLAPTKAAPQSDCNISCSGKAADMCGASMRLSVYGPASAAPVPANLDTVADFMYDGCYTDLVGARSLAGLTITSVDMTPALCAATCANYYYFGLENRNQCFCGMDLGGAAKTSEADCSLKCAGDNSLLCGGANRLNVYKKRVASPPPSNLATVNAFSYQSCWTDAVGARSLTAKSEARAEMTIELCAAFCDGYAYFGVEWATECYCGNEIGGKAATEADCSMLCAGRGSQWCGGPDRLNVYAFRPISPPSSSSSVVDVPPSSTADSTTADSTTADATTADATTTDVTTIDATTADATSEIASETTAKASSTVPTSEASSTETTADATTKVTPSPTPTITLGPQLTTVTSCGGTTLVGGPETSCWSRLPDYCGSLTVSMTFPSMSLNYIRCTSILGPQPASVASCFPSKFTSTNTASTIYSCLQTAAVCTYGSNCATATYTVGQEPTTATETAALASPTVALQNPGFEAGSFAGWTINQPLTAFNVQEVSGVRTHSGSKALRAVFGNDNGHSTEISQQVALFPGAKYNLSIWVSNDSPTDSCSVLLYAQPAATGLTNMAQSSVILSAVPAGTWYRLELPFQALASFGTVRVRFLCNARPPLNSDGGKNTIYLDDMLLVRTDV